MEYNIEDIFEENEDIENILEIETLFATVIKCILVGNKIEKVIKKNKIDIIFKINKEKKEENKEKKEESKENEPEITDIILNNKENNNEENNNEENNNEENNNEENNNEENNNEENNNEENNNEENEKIINKYYKIIALKCHPDKCKNEKFNRFFLMCQDAYKKKDILLMFFIYSKTINDYKHVNKEELRILSDIVDNLDKEQQNKCSSVLYQWEKLTEEEKKMYIEDVKNKNKL